ncbi:MAG TPA: MFS transporter [Steroidobacteraceae bacterium]|nr:MFS transporter [Steroidobacteraceae bacterium]
MALGFALSYTDRQILAILVDPIRSSLHLTDTQLSVLQGAAFAVIYCFSGLPLGRIADLVPRRALLMLAIALWSAGTAACGLAHSFGALLAARFVVGVGEAALAPAGNSLIGEYFPPERRGMAMGVFLTGMIVGVGAAIAIGGGLLQVAEKSSLRALPVIGALAPWRIVLLVAGIAGLVMCAIMATVHEPVGRSFSPRRLRARLLELGEIRRAFGSHAGVLAPLYGALAFWSIVDFALLSWTPALLMRRFAWSPGEVGARLGAIVILTGLIGTPAGGLICDRVTAHWGMRARYPLLLIMALGGIVGIPVGLLGMPVAALASAGCWVFLSSAMGTTAIATILDILPQESRGFGTSTISFNNIIVGLGLGPTLVALVTDKVFHDSQSVGYAMSCIIAPSVLMAILLYAVAMVRASQLRVPSQSLS